MSPPFRATSAAPIRHKQLPSAPMPVRSPMWVSPRVGATHLLITAQRRFLGSGAQRAPRIGNRARAASRNRVSKVRADCSSRGKRALGVTRSHALVVSTQAAVPALKRPDHPRRGTAPRGIRPTRGGHAGGANCGGQRPMIGCQVARHRATYP